MTKQQLEHIIRAAGSITDEKIILVLGSQSILGSVNVNSDIFFQSMEADVFPWKAPEKVELINGAIGEITVFQETFGYYAHGLPPEACHSPETGTNGCRPFVTKTPLGSLGFASEFSTLLAPSLRRDEKRT